MEIKRSQVIRNRSEIAPWRKMRLILSGGVLFYFGCIIIVISDFDSIGTFLAVFGWCAGALGMLDFHIDLFHKFKNIKIEEEKYIVTRWPRKKWAVISAVTLICSNPIIIFTDYKTFGLIIFSLGTCMALICIAHYWIFSIQLLQNNKVT